MNYYDFHIGDYTSRTAHLEPMEDLAYRRMLDLYYMREEPLPHEVDRVAKLVRLRGHEDVIESVLEEFFQLDQERGWVHGKCEDVIAKARTAAERARQNGTKGGRPRKPVSATQETQSVSGENPEETQSVISGNPEKSDSKAPTSHFPLPSCSDPIGSGADAPPTRSGVTAQDQVFAIGVTLLTAASVSDKNARSFLAAQCKAHGPERVVEALHACAAERAVQPVPWIVEHLGAGMTAGRTRTGHHSASDRRAQTIAGLTNPGAHHGRDDRTIDGEARVVG